MICEQIEFGLFGNDTAIDCESQDELIVAKVATISETPVIYYVDVCDVTEEKMKGVSAECFEFLSRLASEARRKCDSGFYIAFDE